MAIPHLPIGAKLVVDKRGRVCIPKLLVEQIAQPGQKIGIRVINGTVQLWKFPIIGKNITVDKYGNIRLTLPKKMRGTAVQRRYGKTLGWTYHNSLNRQAWWHGGKLIEIS